MNKLRILRIKNAKSSGYYFCVNYNICSRSHIYAQLGNAPPKTFFAYSALIMSTLKGSTHRFFSFSAQSQNFTGGWAGPNLP